MIFFGHLGIGNTLASPFRKGLPKRWILIGTIAPDVLDKSLYYGLVLVTGKRAAELGLISGTRTFGHTALLLIAVWSAAIIARSRILAALALGMATHLILDGVTDYFGFLNTGALTPSALLWPFTGWHFPVHPYHTVIDHVRAWKNPFLIGSEVGGLCLLGWDFWKKKHRQEILEFFRRRRQDFRRLRGKRRNFARLER